MNGRRVVVTGLGIVSAIGSDCDSFRDSLANGRHGVAPLTLDRIDELQFRNAAAVPDFQADFGSRGVLLDPFAQFFLVAARQAIEESGLSGSERLHQAAVVTGSGGGGQTTQDALHDELYVRKRRRLTPFAVPRIMANAGASHLSMEAGIGGPGLTISTACSSSNHAIGLGYWMIVNGMVDIAVTGGSEAPLSWAHLKAWDGLRVVSPELCRPFSRDRKGLILGEGGGSLVLETLEAARKRGAEIQAEVVGFGMSSDGDHITKPSSDGAARAMRAAVESAGIAPGEVSYVNAHGTGTTLNDVTETEAIKKVFGEHAGKLMVSSTKSMHGHTLGAAGAIESVATILSLKNDFVPPTANYLGPDPACDLDVVPNKGRATRISHALCNSFAFGGLNAVLVFKRWD